MSSDKLKLVLEKKAEKMSKINKPLNPEEGVSGSMKTEVSAPFKQENVFLRLANYIHFIPKEVKRIL